MKAFILCLLAVILMVPMKADQTTAMNFIRKDCTGKEHNLFAELDSGNVVILEYFMTCSSCLNAARKIQPVINSLEKQIPGKIRFYMLAYTNGYSCETASNFINTNSLQAVPFDSGASQVAYYGGFGMPTVVVVGGKDHKVLFTDIGFSSGDEQAIGDAIKTLYNLSDVSDESATNFSVSPQPATDRMRFHWNEELSQDAECTLANMQGQIVRHSADFEWNYAANQAELPVQGLENGVYVLVLNNHGRRQRCTVLVSH